MVKNVALAVTVFLLLSSLGVVGFAAAPQSSESYVHPLTTTTGAVYFNETGLASGTSWSVVYNSLNESSTSSSIKFTETVNIEYNYKINEAYSGITEYTPSPQTGTAKAVSSVSISFSGSTFTANLTTDRNPTDENLKTWYYSDPSGPAPSGSYYVVFPYINGVNTTSMSVSSNGVVYVGYYLWSGTGSQTIYFLYSVHGTSLSFDSSTMTVTVNSDPTVTISASPTTTESGQSVTFSSTVSGGTSPFTYQWYLNGTAVSGATSSTWTTSTLPTGNPTINVSLTDTAGYLVRSNVITETVYPVFSAYISSNKNPSDVYQSITFTASASGGSGTYSSYAFYLSGVLEQNTSSSTWSYEFTTANTYNVSVIVYDSAGEHAVSTWTQTVNPPLQVSISAPRYVIDYGMTITFQSTVTGGTAPYSYQWDLDGQNVSGATSSTYTTSPTLAVGTHTISLWVTDSAGDPEPGKTNSLIPVIITALGLNPYGVPGASDVSNGTVRIGQPFSVRVADIGNIPMAMMGSLAGVNQRPYRFAWYLDGNLIPNATSFIYSTVEFALGVYNFSVRITSLPNETNNRSVFHGIWWGFENVTIVGNVLPPDSVEFIEQGLPVGAWWGAALFTTATYGVALSDDLGAALPVTANGLPTAIITVPTGRYNFSIQYFPKNGYLNYTPELTIGNRTFLSPNNGSRIVGPITLPFATQNGSEIIKVTFVPLNGNVYYSNSSGTQGSISKVSSNVTNSTILPIPTANQQLSDPLYSFAVIGILQTVNKPMANIGVLFIVGIVAIGLVAASLVIQRANRKKQRDKEVDY